MKHTLLISALFISTITYSQKYPFDTTTWEISAGAYILENIKGQQSIYLQNGSALLKNESFENGTVEFDVMMTERQSFPGISFRINGSNTEQFYLRPHQSGNPDANQYTPIWNGLAGWQLYFGPAYSFTYEYNFDVWTHVKLVVNNDKGQVYLDYAEKPNLSFKLKHEVKSGGIALSVSFAPMHFANFSINKTNSELVDFPESDPIEYKNIVTSWQISNPISESDLTYSIRDVQDGLTWVNAKSEENHAVNIASVRKISDGNTVLAKLILNSKSKQVLPFDFGYSDRVVVFVNGKPTYSGNNRWRTRDYRYLGTVGFFDTVILNLEKGDNTIVFAVSEDFGGWGIMGRVDQDKVSIK